MIRDRFTDGDIVSVDFGASLRGDNRLFFVPADVAVKNSLKGVLRNTVEAFDHIDGDWQEFDVSEDYGEARRVFAHRNNDLMGVFSAIYDAGALDELTDLVGRLSQLEYYFAVFRDRDGRKAVGIKKATQFKSTLGAQNLLIRLVNDTLTMIEDRVLKLDRDFDVVVTDEHVFLYAPRRAEQVGQFTESVARSAEAKVQTIHDTLTFLDLSRIKDKIASHPHQARLAAAIAAKPELAQFDRDRVVRLAEKHGVKLTEHDGRLRCRVSDETKLLEVLDARRYDADLTTAAPVPYRARAREKVSAQ